MGRTIATRAVNLGQRLARRCPRTAAAATVAISRPCAAAQRAAEPGRAPPITLPESLVDMTDPTTRTDIADPAPSALATLHTDKALPMEPTDAILPTDPIDNVDP